jgi:hypothetical protein
VGSQEKLGEIRPMDLLATSQVGSVTEAVSVYTRNTENIIKDVRSFGGWLPCAPSRSLSFLRGKHGIAGQQECTGQPGFELLTAGALVDPLPVAAIHSPAEIVRNL